MLLPPVGWLAALFIYISSFSLNLVFISFHVECYKLVKNWTVYHPHCNPTYDVRTLGQMVKYSVVTELKRDN